jgi:uncharacterized protein with LGFP repeats
MTTERESVTVPTPAGPVVIRGRIHARWVRAGAEKTPDGDDVRAHLGHPLGAQTSIPENQGGGAMQLFLRGLIVARADGRAFVVYGAIYDHYVAAGGPASAIGLPISDEEAAGHEGRVSHFQTGDIYWRADAGAREVAGASRALYASGRDPFARSWINRGVAALGIVRRAAASFRSPRR